MGGFFAGLGSAIGGAGSQVPQLREQLLTQWSHSRDALANLIAQARENAHDQQHYNTLLEQEFKVRGAQPGDNKILKHAQNAYQSLVVHPETIKTMQQTGILPNQKPPQTAAGPPPAGQTPGSLAPMIVGQPKDASAALGGSSPAEPTGKPIDLGAMGGGGGAGQHIGVPETPMAAPVAQPAQAPQQISMLPSPQVTAQPPIQPVGQGGDDARYHQQEAAGFVLPAVAKAHVPFAQGEAQLAEKKALDHYIISQYGPERLNYLKQQLGPGGWEQLQPWQKLAAAQSAGGMTPTNMPMAAFNEELVSPFTKGSNLPPGTVAAAGGDLDPEGTYRVMRSRMNNQYIAYPTDIRAEFTPHTVTGPTGEQSFVSPSQAAAGSAGTKIPGAINPSFAPTSTSSLKPIQTVDAQGNAVTRLEPVTSTRTKGGRAAGGAAIQPVSGTGGGGAATPHPSGGPREFPRPFTPEQQLTGEQKLGQYNIAIDRASSVMKRLPLLNNLLDAGKINLELDTTGFLKAILNRNMSMTPEEEQLAGDFRTLTEDINLLRGPLGATGFRGPEAFAALQAQRGQLMARPGITAQVLTNTLRALRAQQAPLAKRFKGGDVQAEQQTPPPTTTGNVIHWGRDAQGNPVRLSQ